MKKKIKSGFLILINTLVLFLLIDFIVTNYLGIRGPSKFYTSENPIGHVNNPNFSGNYGGPLNEYFSSINITDDGSRKSFSCKDFPINTIFIGDSFTAGFEVADDLTFVSLINKECLKYKINGINTGVRAHDTQQVVANYEKFSKLYNHTTVFYLAALNDFVNLSHSTNIVKRFGRALITSEEKIIFIEPTKDIFEKSYMDFRVFITDNFYFFRRLMDFLFYMRAIDPDTNPIKIDSFKNDNTENFIEFIRLIKILNKKVNENNAKLAIGLYPCLYKNCEQHVYYENEIFDQFKDSNIKILLLVKNINDKEKMGLVNKKQLRFSKDDHLSKIGHEILSKEIGTFLKK